MTSAAVALMVWPTASAVAQMAMASLACSSQERIVMDASLARCAPVTDALGRFQCGVQVCLRGLDLARGGQIHLAVGRPLRAEPFALRQHGADRWAVVNQTGVVDADVEGRHGGRILSAKAVNELADLSSDGGVPGRLHAVPLAVCLCVVRPRPEGLACRVFGA